MDTSTIIMMLLLAFALGYVTFSVIESSIQFFESKEEQDEWIDADYMDDEHDFSQKSKENLK